MSSSKNAPSDSPSTTQLLVGTFLDTTWRMFAPVLGLTLVGWVIDKTAHTRPVGTLVGLGLGVLGSAFLTIRLYQTVTQQMHKEHKK
ncbi:MAG: AtpZ/AtpI family protein [Candidatus Saccharibacteria bacterium]|nr:AtpZ/AtpI family protein [Candidatus Saccharibacteria bacterium]